MSGERNCCGNGTSESGAAHPHCVRTAALVAAPNYSLGGLPIHRHPRIAARLRLCCRLLGLHACRPRLPTLRRLLVHRRPSDHSLQQRGSEACRFFQPLRVLLSWLLLLLAPALPRIPWQTHYCR